MINNENLILEISVKTGLSVETTNKLFSAFLDTLQEELIDFNYIKLVDFGNFKVVKRAPRKGYNPYYKKTTIIPACFEPVFIPGKALKDIINKEAKVD